MTSSHNKKEFASGAYGKVYLINDGKECLKTQDLFRPYDDEEDGYIIQDGALREYLFYKHVKHPNIPNCLELQITPDDFKLNIRMPLASGGSLYKYIEQNTTYDRYKNFTKIFKQLALVLKFLHDNNITHGDIKPTNILVNLVDDVWLTDFGSTAINLSKRTHTTYWYLSPEECVDNKIGHTNDIWSLGMCMYIYLADKHMYGPDNRDQIVKWFKNKSLTQEVIYDKIDKNVNNCKLKGILKSCLRIDHNTRINALDLCYLLGLKSSYIDSITCSCKLSSDFITNYKNNTKKTRISEDEIDILQNLQEIYLDPTNPNDPFKYIIDDKRKKNIIRIIEHL
jgi:serine/threonine protein kinase